MKSSKITVKTLKDYLFLFALFLLPFDSFPIFIGGSIYRPVSIFPILLYFILLVYDSIAKKQIKKNIVVVFLLYLLFLGITLIKAAFYDDIGGVKDYFFTATLGFTAYTVYTDYFEKVRQNSLTQTDFYNKIAKLFLKGMIFPCLIGLIQTSQKFLHIESTFLKKLYSLFTYRFGMNRVFLVCGEPSWAVIYLIILEIFLLFATDIKYRKLLMMIDGLLILFTFSLLGWMSVLILFVIYYCFYLVKKPAKLSYLLFFIFLFVMSYLIFDKFIVHYIGNAYLLSRYHKVQEFIGLLGNMEEMNNFLQNADGSLFIRLVNPIIGVKMGFDNPIFGVGGGYYYRFYPSYIDRCYPAALQFMEVKSAVSNGYQITCRNIFCRFFAEFGVVAGFVILLNFILKVRKIARDDNRGLFLLALIFTVVINFDSLCYLPFIFLVCFFNSYANSEIKVNFSN